MKCNYPIASLVCPFHYNGECLRKHKYECPALVKRKAEKKGNLVEVVRCKDCKWAEQYRTASGNVYFSCAEHCISSLIDNDYCSYGERKEKDNAEIH